MESIQYKELDKSDIKQNLLEDFDRYQEIKQYYKKENGNWILKDHVFFGNWNKERYEEVNDIMKNTIINKSGSVFGAFDGKKLIGFAVLGHKTFGTKNQYIELKFIHVSNGYRHKGIGKELFKYCIEKAKEIVTIQNRSSIYKTRITRNSLLNSFKSVKAMFLSSTNI